MKEARERRDTVAATDTLYSHTVGEDKKGGGVRLDVAMRRRRGARALTGGRPTVTRPWRPRAREGVRERGLTCGLRLNLNYFKSIQI
jgi:hypothetical protein